jgi:uncharacterized protein DUF1993
VANETARNVQSEKVFAMTVSMYAVSIPIFIRHLNGLNTVLDKAAAWAAARKVSESDIQRWPLSAKRTGALVPASAYCNGLTTTRQLVAGNPLSAEQRVLEKTSCFQG